MRFVAVIFKKLALRWPGLALIKIKKIHHGCYARKIRKYTIVFPAFMGLIRKYTIRPNLCFLNGGN